MIPGDPVLVLADEEDMRGTLAVAIAEEIRRPVAAAPDAATAARLARTCRPAALVVDLGRDGGPGPLRALREEPALAGCPIIALGPAAVRDEALAIGATAFVAEPVDMGLVVAALASALTGLGDVRALPVENAA